MCPDGAPPGLAPASPEIRENAQACNHAWLDFDSKAGRHLNNPVTINGLVTLPL
jgi:hypothetical protein